MGFYIDASELMKTFGVKFTVYPKAEGGHRENGRWIPAPDPEPIEVVEPIFPLGRVSAYSQMLLTRDVGDMERYELEWLSSGKYPLGTVVVHNGRRLVVRNSDDYKDYSNLTIYYLSADSEDNLGGDGDDPDAGA